MEEAVQYKAGEKTSIQQKLQGKAMNNACAVVITFHPNCEVLENLSKIRSQAERVVVIDNGSSSASLNQLRDASSKLDFELIENGENLGIAAALNTGIHWAETNSLSWVFLFDQDSAVTEGFVETMIAAFEKHPREDCLAILVPRYIDKRSGAGLPSQTSSSGGLETAMTSGSLMRISTFHRLGPFMEDFFIDIVDYEYSLRLRSRGYFIEECENAILLHSPGEPKVFKFRGLYLFQTANYTAIRRYYQERNKICLARKYWKTFPSFCCKLFLLSLEDCIKCLLSEDRKWDKFSYACLGIMDGLRGRMGRFDRS